MVFLKICMALTWILAVILVPLMRMAAKAILNKFGLWLRETYIIGNGKNALDAYKATKSIANNLG